MKNNLSASPTPDDLTDPETTWHCPYCDYTNTELAQLREHITNTIEKEHEGVNGWSPTQDIIATNKNDDVVRRIEGAGTRPDEDHHLGHGEKKKLIINAWLELNKQRDIEAISSILPVSKEYVRRLTQQLENGELTEQDYQAEIDWELRNELRDQLQTHYENEHNTPETEMNAHTDTNTTTEKGEKKKQIINAYLIDPNISPKHLDEVINSGYEYIRRTIKQIKDGDISTSEIKTATDEQTQTELKTALETIGIETPGEPGTSINDQIHKNRGKKPGTPEYIQVLDNSSKKKRVLNSVILQQQSPATLDFSLHYTDIADAADCSDEYARRIVKQVQENEISDTELDEASNTELQNALQRYYNEHNMINTQSNDDTTKENTTTQHEIDFTTNDPFKNTNIQKREALVNIYLFDPDLHYSNASTLAGCSNEYARQTFKKLDNGTLDAETHENTDIQEALIHARETGTLEQVLHENEEDKDEQNVRSDQDTQLVEKTNNHENMVPVTEIKRIKEHTDLLLRQAEYEGDAGHDTAKAEFIAREISNELEKVLPQ